METMKMWAGRAFAALGVVGSIAALLALLFAGGEIRNGFRAACGAREAGSMTRGLCDLFDVVPPPPEVAVELPDSDEAERADRYVAPACTTAQALEIIDHEAKDLAALERLLQRDMDGDGRTGSVTRKPRPAPDKSAAGGGSSQGFDLGVQAGELVLADKASPELPRGARVVATVPETGGPVRVDVIPNEVPDYEWLHELTWRVAGDLPVNDHELGDGLEASVQWDLARAHALRVGLLPYVEKLGDLEAEALGKSTDWGVKAVLSAHCHGLFDCKVR